MKPTPVVAPKVSAPDGATLVSAMTLTGIVKTSKGVAVLTAQLGPDGAVKSLKLGNSQDARFGKPFVAEEHKRMLASLAVKL